MSISITKTSAEPGAALLAVSVPVESVRSAEDRATAAYQARVKLPGFRKGKAPAAVVRKRFADDIRQQTLETVVRESWERAVEQEALKPIAEPHIHNLKWEHDAAITFELHVEVRPDLTLGRLANFRLTRKVTSVTGEQVDAQINELREQKAPWAPVSGEQPKPKDLVHVTIAQREGVEVKEPVPYQLVLGEGRAIPEVEERIMTLLPGETVDATVRFPDDFSEEAKRGQTRDIRIALQEVKRQQLPELTDAFAREVGDFESLEALRRAVREDLEQDARREADSRVRAELIEQIVAANSVAAPRPLVDRALQAFADSAAGTDALRSPVALHMGYQGVPGRYPGTLLGVIAYERQRLYDAQRHGQLVDRYKTDPRGMERPANDPALDALVPAVRGTLPVFFAASRENEIRRALAIGREFGLDLTIVGAGEAFRATDALVPTRKAVVVSVDFARSPQTTGWAYRQTQRRAAGDSAAADSTVQQTLQGNAAALHKAGVRFALASGGLRPTEFLANVRKAIAAGLPRATALEALTIRAAEVAGVGRQLGSIEAGKIANLVVSEGDLLGDSAKVRHVFVDGERYEVVAAPVARGRGASGGGGGGAAAQVGGTWDLTTTTPQGVNTGTITLSQDGNQFSGTATGQFGSAPIEGGQVNGRRVTWSVTVSVGGQSFIVSYAAEVDGNRMSGTAEVGSFGSATFTGEKRP